MFSEIMAEAKAMSTRPINHNSELPISKGDTILIYGKSNDSKIYLVKVRH